MRDLSIVYDGIGCFDKNTGIGNYFIVLPIQDPLNNYEFKIYNFSHINHNRVLIHMVKKTTGGDTDFSEGCISQPYMPAIIIDLNNLKTDNNDITSLPNYTDISTDEDIEVILYHNDVLDSMITAYHDNTIEPPFYPSRVGFGTFKKV